MNVESTVPESILAIAPENKIDCATLHPCAWDQGEAARNCGNFRTVRHITRKLDGSLIVDATGRHVGLYVKFPEVRFTAAHNILRRDEIWWGGPRSGERCVMLDDENLHDAQANAEFCILKELALRGIPVEIPQALIRDARGRAGVVTLDLATSSSLYQSDIEKVIKDLECKEGWKAVDFGGHNIVKGHVIDVNRWIVPKITDVVRQRLKAAIYDKLAESGPSPAGQGFYTLPSF